MYCCYARTDQMSKFITYDKNTSSRNKKRKKEETEEMACNYRLTRYICISL